MNAYINTISFKTFFFFLNVEDKATYNHLSQIPQKWELCVVVTTFFRPSIHQNNIATTSKLPTSVKFIPDLSLSLSLSLSHTHTHTHACCIFIRIITHFIAKFIWLLCIIETSLLTNQLQSHTHKTIIYYPITH